jgi:hypothetical protein
LKRRRQVADNSVGTSPNSESTETAPNSGGREKVPEPETCVAAPLEFSSNHVHAELRSLSSAVNEAKTRSAAANNRHDTRSGADVIKLFSFAADEAV